MLVDVVRVDVDREDVVEILVLVDAAVEELDVLLLVRLLVVEELALELATGELVVVPVEVEREGVAVIPGFNLKVSIVATEATINATTKMMTVKILEIASRLFLTPFFQCCLYIRSDPVCCCSYFISWN